MAEVGIRPGNAAVDAVANPSAARGGTLRVVSAGDVDSLDPGRTYYVYGWVLQRLFQRTLVAFAPAPGVLGRRVVPDLAEGLGEPADGGRRWTYRLRPDVYFEDGSPIRSDDIRHAIERLFARDVINGGPAYLLDLLDDGGGYAGPYGAGHPELATIRTPDARTVEFHLNAPFADFDYLMALPTSTPVPRAHDTGRTYGSRPMASGPYRIVRYEPGRQLLLERNPAWNRATDPVRTAPCDRVEVTMGLSPAELCDRLFSGAADVSLDTSVQGAAQQRLLGDPMIAAYADNPATGIVRFLSVQTGVPPFGDVHARRAVRYALDKCALQAARGGPVVGGDIASSMAPPGLLAGAVTGPVDDGRPRLDLARAELAAAGLPDGFETVIATVPQGKAPLVAEEVRRCLARVGIAATVRPIEQGAYFRDHLGIPERVRAEGLGLAVVAWAADFPTGYGFFHSIVDGRNILARGNQNWAELNDPVVNELLDRARSTLSAADRDALWERIDRRVTESAALLPFLHDRSLWYRNPRVTNAYVLGSLGLYDLQAMGVR
jgi:peptide/nickel transport system substrate-binding protein